MPSIEPSIHNPITLIGIQVFTPLFSPRLRIQVPKALGNPSYQVTSSSYPLSPLKSSYTSSPTQGTKLCASPT